MWLLCAEEEQSPECFIYHFAITLLHWRSRAMAQSEISYHCCSWAHQNHLCYSRPAGVFEVKQKRDS